MPQSTKGQAGKRQQPVSKKKDAKPKKPNNVIKKSPKQVSSQLTVHQIFIAADLFVENASPERAH
ncbi:hypothetical protein TELCIR_15573 [Teladorsagia circumcincta]|uniref:Uncharacterized protein n=1 Tax=Teladorsagia circumcincta TaxID=45464 RepID=A0A2G9U047_TELCI|nr:hypothetical protein TELCIR_15573 [Teladorsagia circumcincta]